MAPTAVFFLMLTFSVPLLEKQSSEQPFWRGLLDHFVETFPLFVLIIHWFVLLYFI